MDKQTYRRKLKELCLGLKDSFCGETFATEAREQLALLRTYFAPRGDDPLSTTYDEASLALDYRRQQNSVQVEQLHSSPYEVVKRSVSGFLSYHHTPYEKFFKSEQFNFDLRGLKQDARDLLTKNDTYWNNADEAIHAVMWQPNNIMAEAMYIRDRIIFNIGVKTLDLHPSLGVKKVTHPIENVIYYSSNGEDTDIQGVWEGLTWFQYKNRFPKHLTDLDREHQEMYDKAYSMTTPERTGSLEGADVKVYRINLPVKVFLSWVKGYLLSKGEKEFLAQWEKHYAKDYKLKLGEIVDIKFNEFGDLISLESLDYRTVIIGHLGYIDKGGIRGQSQGDTALGVAKILQETEQILINGYERAYGPAFAVPSALDAEVAQLIGRDEFIFTDEPEAIKPIHVPIDMNNAVAIARDYWEERLKDIMFLNIFSLIEKNRMPINEITMRRADGFRQLGLFVTADAKYSLEPEVVSIYRMLIRGQLGHPPIASGSIRVSYVSPLMQAIRSSTLEPIQRTVALAQQVDQTNEGVSRKVINYEEVLIDGLKKMDQIKYMKSLAEREEVAKAEALEQQMRMTQVNAEAQKATLDQVARARELQGGGNAQQGTPPRAG